MAHTQNLSSSSSAFSSGSTRTDNTKRLIDLFHQLFQLDEPNLDFGIYRVMHAKKDVVDDFLNNRLPEKITRSLANAGCSGDSNLVANIYDDLYRFFSRYYAEGDFMPRRFYKTTKSEYVVPYNGEEVFFHWANADQYYIKTTDRFTNFVFIVDGQSRKKYKVAFKIARAEEEEHGNIKENEASYFIPCKEAFVTRGIQGLDAAFSFEYRHLTSQDKKNLKEAGFTETEKNKIQEALVRLAEKKLEECGDDVSRAILAETEDSGSSVFLRKFRQWTTRNMFDFFIHKDLRGFLCRELDFYLKNDVLNFQDEDANWKRMRARIRAVEEIASDLIGFLAQTEDFQKKLWLKKKFVVETNYCITLDHIDDSFYDEILNNVDQIEEWKKLFAIDRIKGSPDDLISAGSPGFTEPVTKEFLETNDKLVLDTEFFSNDFKDRLLSTIEDFDQKCNGLLIHGDNYHALNLIQNRYKEQVKCVYIDPPYNTGKDGFIYKDSYQHSSWLSMMNCRLEKTLDLLDKNGAIFISIDDHEVTNLKFLCDRNFGVQNELATLIWNKQHSQQQGVFKKYHESILVYGKDTSAITNIKGGDGTIEAGALKKISKKNPASNFTFPAGTRFDAPDGTVFKGTFGGSEKVTVVSGKMEAKDHKLAEDVTLSAGWTQKSQMTTFFLGLDTVDSKGQKVLEFYFNSAGKLKCIKDQESITPPTILPEYGMVSSQTAHLSDMFGKEVFSSPKPVDMISDFTRWFSRDSGLVLDFFAGSGTTGEAVIKRRREEGSTCQYILVEIGDHFNNILKPRIEKAVYADNWRNGVPSVNTPDGRHGVSQIIKYMRLESYEDSLNNLRVTPRVETDFKFDNDGGEQKNDVLDSYVLNYMLDFETKDSSSLLNVDKFVDPFDYEMEIRDPANDVKKSEKIDLVETFNYLIGLRVDRVFRSEYKDLDTSNTGEHGRLTVTLKDVEPSPNDDTREIWRFKAVVGSFANNERVLVVWRNHRYDTDEVTPDSGSGAEFNDIDDAALNAWLRSKKNEWGWGKGKNSFSVLYVNGSHSLCAADDELKGLFQCVKNTEKEFKTLMFS